MRSRPLWLLVPAAAGVLSAGALAPAGAAAFATPKCEGTQARGIGPPVEETAHLGSDGLGDSTGWAYTFSHVTNSVCPQNGFFDAEPTYDPVGSAAGLSAMCVDGVHLDVNHDWAATETPPTASEIAAMSSCAGAVTLPLAIHTIPVAQIAIAVIVHLPTGCTIGADDNASTGNRFAILNQQLEQAFLNGTPVPTWSTLLPNSPSCTGAITRVARYDQSGQTFAFEQYLVQIGDASTWQPDSTSAQQYQSWPHSASNIVYGGTTAENPPGTCPLSGPGSTPPDPHNNTETQPVDRLLCNGPTHIAQAVLDTPGSIGYVDMGTAIEKGFQYPAKGTSSTFWVPVQNNGTGTKGAAFAEPAAAAGGYLAGSATGGANCDSAGYTPPGGADPTLSAWETVIGSSPTTADYPICGLTYELAWDDAANAYGNTPAVDARQRAVKDYLLYTTNTGANDGQSILRSLNYDELPSSLDTVSRTGVASIHFP